MGSYRQSCPCRGRSLAAARDCERYDREIQGLSISLLGLATELVDRRDPTIRLEIQRLEQERSWARKCRNRAYARLLEPPVRCLNCDGRGYRDTPGAVGGYGRPSSNVQRAEKVS